MLKSLVRAVMRLADDRRDHRRHDRYDRYDRHDRFRYGRSDRYRSHHRRLGWKDMLIDAVVRRLLKR